MKTRRRYPFQHLIWKLAAAIIIATTGTLTGFALKRIAGTEASATAVDWAAYDWLFRRWRPAADRTKGPVVIAAIDEYSLNAIAAYLKRGWPWPRTLYGAVIQSAQAAGAKAVVFDLTFEGPSVIDPWEPDSEELAKAADNATIPVIFGVQSENASPPTRRFTLPTTRPLLGAVNVGSQSVLRQYEFEFHGIPTLGASAASLFDPRLKDLRDRRPFLLHWYGPFNSTHLRVPICDFILPQVPGFVAMPPEHGGETADQIRQRLAQQLNGKIVVIGAVMHTLFDQKASPYSPIHPGVDFHATAIENLLEGYEVFRARRLIELASLILPCLLAACATILFRRTVFKLGIPIAIAIAIGAAIVLLFQQTHVVFLTPMPPMVALIVATVLGLSWSYITEGRQRRFLSRAFSQYVSPAVVNELERNPDSLNLGGQKRTVSVLFSDIRSFTTITEKLEATEIEKFMNTYLGAMTDVVLASGGTVDKYIGDAVMAFWNAPLDQKDHAVVAVKTALAMNAKEREFQPQLAELARSEILTRIGIATGEVMVGNFGSAGKINYTVLGDSVNLASRLEGANKIYGSQILLAEPTALAAGSAVLTRRLGLLRVKGKLQAMAVYEAMGLLPGTPEMIDRKARYEAAFGAYLIQDWPGAVRTIEGLLADYPHDLPAQNFLDLVREVSANPPEGEWDGVYVAHEK